MLKEPFTRSVAAGVAGYVRSVEFRALPPVAFQPSEDFVRTIIDASSERYTNARTHDDVVIIRDPGTSVIVVELYYHDGELHRDPVVGSAVIVRDAETSHVVREEYRVHGVLDRDTKAGPAYIERNRENGATTREEYRRRGKLHRRPSSMPAVIERDASSGAITRREYWVDGQRQRRASCATRATTLG